MGFGNFGPLCARDTLPACNLFEKRVYKRVCVLKGFCTGTHDVRNIGDTILCVIGMGVAIWLIICSQRKRAAVGRREMQLFLLTYFFICFVQMFSMGGWLNDHGALIWFTAMHLGFIASLAWLLVVQAFTHYQISPRNFEDGTVGALSVTLVISFIFFISTLYISLDTGFTLSGKYYHPGSDLYAPEIYGLSLLWPLLAVIFFVLAEIYLVLRRLRERRPLGLLAFALVAFIIGQIFMFGFSVFICESTNGRLDGSFFETFFLIWAIILLWGFWSSITEDNWQEDGPLASA